MSSENVLADRRFQFAEMLRARGDRDAAIELYQEALDLAPDWAAAHFALADTLSEAGRAQDACKHFAAYLRLSEIDEMGAELRLALLGAAPVPDRMPEAYVRTLFDQYADRFEESLLTRLDYSAPEQIFAAVEKTWPSGWHAQHVLDLGCGTGLAGEAFRARCTRLEGVDLSAQMIQQAARKNIYDGLSEGEALAALAPDAGPFDLIVAADVLVYMGDLEPLFAAVAETLRPGGLFAFSVERARDEDFLLRDKCRYAHSAAYLQRLAIAHGLEMCRIDETSCRAENGSPVAHMVCVAERPGLALAAALPTALAETVEETVSLVATKP